MTNILSREQMAFLIKSGCDKSEIKRVEDAIISIENATDKMPDSAGGSVRYIQPSKLHKTGRFSSSDKLRVESCLQDLVAIGACTTFEDTASRQGKRASDFFAINPQYPRLFVDRDQARLAILTEFLALFGKLDEQLLVSFFPSVKVMMPQSSNMQPAEIIQSKFGPLRVLRDFSYAWDQSGTLRFNAGQIIDNPELCKSLLANEAAVCSVTEPPSASCPLCKNTFKVDPNQRSEARVLIYLKNVVFIYEQVMFRRKPGDLEFLPHLVRLVMDQSLDGFAFAKPDEWIKCTSTICGQIFAAPRMMGNAQQTLEHKLQQQQSLY